MVLLVKLAAVIFLAAVLANACTSNADWKLDEYCKCPQEEVSPGSRCLTPLSALFAMGASLLQFAGAESCKGPGTHPTNC